VDLQLASVPPFVYNFANLQPETVAREKGLHLQYNPIYLEIFSGHSPTESSHISSVWREHIEAFCFLSTGVHARLHRTVSSGQVLLPACTSSISVF